MTDSTLTGMWRLNRGYQPQGAGLALAGLRESLKSVLVIALFRKVMVELYVGRTGMAED